MTRRGRAPLPAARLWARCRRDRRSGCLLFVRGSRVNGYGVLSVNGHYVRAHRLAWMLARGPIPPGKLVTHSCIGRRHCCEPTHLKLGTYLSNAADAKAQGRTARGERNGLARLTARAVRQIRRQYARGLVRYADLADEFDVDATTIGAVIRGETWRHLLPAAS